MRLSPFGILLVVMALGLGSPRASLALGEVTERVSVDGSGSQTTDFGSNDSAISGTGQFVAFQSESAQLVPDDANEWQDIFVRDLLAGSTERVSVNSNGDEANGYSENPQISADGHIVAFTSLATNLALGDGTDQDVFVHDRTIGVTEMISVSSAEEPAAGCCSDDPSVSNDGRFVAFSATASNLVDGDTNGHADVFVRDLVAGITERVSLATGVTEGDGQSTLPAISGDGRFVAFTSRSTNLVSDDTNGQDDIFVRDRLLGVTELVSFHVDGTQRDSGSTLASISSDGTIIAYQSASRVFVFDRTPGITTDVAPGAQGLVPDVSGDGRFIAFHTPSPVLAGDNNGVNDAYLYDRILGTLERLSVDIGGGDPDAPSSGVSVTMDSRFAAFRSSATDLVDNDTNSLMDVFARDRCPDGSCLEPPPPPVNEREIVFIQGIDSESFCADIDSRPGNDGFIDRVAWMRSYIESADWIQPEVDVVGYHYFSYSGAFCVDDVTPGYFREHTCDGVDKAAAELKTFIEARTRVPVTLIAHSMGGLVSGTLVSGAPDGWLDEHVASVIAFDSLRCPPDSSIHCEKIAGLVPL